jgi:hypothetical protein
MASGPDEADLHLPGFGRLSQPAQERLMELLQQYGSKVLAEASRLESDWRTQGRHQPEITSRDIDDAAVFVQRSPHDTRTTKARTFDTISYIAAFVGGVFGNNITTPVGAVGFAITAAIGFYAYSSRGEL